MTNVRPYGEVQMSPFDISVNLHIVILGLLVNKPLNVQKVLRKKSKMDSTA